MIERIPIAVTRNYQKRKEWEEYARKGVNSHRGEGGGCGRGGAMTGK